MEEKKIYKEINVEVLNIVEADGLRKLCLFNSQNIPSLIMGGRDVLPGHRAGSGIAGMVFFNTEGDECGGLVFSSERLPDNGYRSGLSMTFDQYKNDQVVQMTCSEENRKRMYGFRIFDRPNENIEDTVKKMAKIQEMPDGEEKDAAVKEALKGNAVRMFMGKQVDGSVGITINDSESNPLIRVYVDADDQPHFEVLDKHGAVSRSLI